MNATRVTILFWAIAILTSSAAGQQILKKDFGNNWKVYYNDRYEPFSNDRSVKTIYFLVDADKFPNDNLCIRTVGPFAIFINGKLAADLNKNVCLSIDSLSRKFLSPRLWIAIHQEKIISATLQTTIETSIANRQSFLESSNKPPTFFRDFVIIALLILLLMLVVVLRLNPKLASDYFSVTRIFSARESDDSQVYTRISSSTNVLFYGFSSLILGFYLMIIFHFVTPVYTVASYFQATSFFSSVAQWLVLSFIVLMIFLVKIILIYAVSNMFGSREIAGIHFFNWIRMLLIVFGLLSIILFTYFVLRGQSVGLHVILLKLVAWCLVLWTVVIFLKLNGRSGYSLFHLFSYICATEIIPLLIIVTVLYK